MYSHSSSFKQGAVPPKPVGLLERVREVARYKHYNIRTEQAYVEWIRRFVQFHGKRHPREMGRLEVWNLICRQNLQRAFKLAVQHAKICRVAMT